MATKDGWEKVQENFAEKDVHLSPLESKVVNYFSGKTPIEQLAIQLQARGFECLHIRQPIPSSGSPGIIAFCRRADLSPLTNRLCSLGRLLVSDEQIQSIRNGRMQMDDLIKEAVAELE